MTTRNRLVPLVTGAVLGFVLIRAVQPNLVMLVTALGVLVVIVLTIITVGECQRKES